MFSFLVINKEAQILLHDLFLICLYNLSLCLSMSDLAISLDNLKRAVLMGHHVQIHYLLKLILVVHLFHRLLFISETNCTTVVLKLLARSIIFL